MSGAGLRDLVPAIVEAARAGEALVIATVVSASPELGVAPGSRLLVHSDGRRQGTLREEVDREVVAQALLALRDKRPGLRSFQVSTGATVVVGMEGGNLDVYFDLLDRPSKLVIVGAGHIALPLARLGALLGFHVAVLDDRPEFATRDRFPEANDILIGPYAETLASMVIDSDTYVVLVTRGHVHDQSCLETVLATPAAYIGMIGSKVRVRTVVRHMEEAGYRLEDFARVHAPVGIDIGAHTPAEIAVAIAAEIINVKRGGRAPSLALREKPRVP